MIEKDGSLLVVSSVPGDSGARRLQLAPDEAVRSKLLKYERIRSREMHQHRQPVQDHVDDRKVMVKESELLEAMGSDIPDLGDQAATRLGASLHVGSSEAGHRDPCLVKQEEDGHSSASVACDESPAVAQESSVDPVSDVVASSLSTHEVSSASASNIESASLIAPPEAVADVVPADADSHGVSALEASLLGALPPIGPRVAQPWINLGENAPAVASKAGGDALLGFEQIAAVLKAANVMADRKVHMTMHEYKVLSGIVASVFVDEESRWSGEGAFSLSKRFIADETVKRIFGLSELTEGQAAENRDAYRLIDKVIHRMIEKDGSLLVVSSVPGDSGARRLQLAPDEAVRSKLLKYAMKKK
jgi:hypothetical protein